MPPALRTFIVALPLFAVGLLTAVMIGEENYILAAVILAVVAGAGIYFAFARGARIEAFAVTLLVCGYIIGGKGFSYLAVFRPLFVGEATMILAAAVLVSRLALARQGWPKSPILLPLTCFGAYCAAHLFFDFRAFGLTALRDSALAYYAFFALLGLSLSQHLPSVQLIKRWVPRALFAITLLIHPVLAATNMTERITLAGVPVFYQNSDSIVTAYLMASIYLYLRSRQASTHARLFYVILSVACFGYIVYLARSTYTISSIVLVTFLWLIHHRRYIIQTVLVGSVAGTLLLVAYTQDLLPHDRERFAFIQNKIVALARPTGEGGTVADQTIAWRLTWWSTIFKTTMNSTPMLGSGFGSDISGGFFATFYGRQRVTEEHLAVRSPHNVLFTVLGRLGLVGVGLFLWVLAGIVRVVKSTIPFARRGELDNEDLIFICLVINNLVASFFSVILEGPVGAIIFWLVLGLVSGRVAQLSAARSGATKPVVVHLGHQRRFRPQLAGT